jgi:hypothetical protein
LTERRRAFPRARAAVVAALVLAALFLLAQILLPDLAERRIRSRLEGKASVQRVDVRAFPAIKLLWNHADRVEIRMGELRVGGGELVGLVDDAGGVKRLDARAGTLRTGVTVLHEARLEKDGDRLTGQARMTDTDVRTAFPVTFRITPVGVQDGLLVLRGGVDVLGQVVGVTARLVASGGGIVVAPEGIPLVGSLINLTVFRDDRVTVRSLTARRVPQGYLLNATGGLS